MKNFRISISVVLILVCQNLYAQANKIIGTWLTEDKKGKIQIYQQGNLYFGKIIGGDQPERLDTNNPDAKLQSRKLTGMIILSNFEYDGKDTWENGKIYDPDNGKTYSCLMKLKNANSLEIRGYVGLSIFGRTSVWTRIE
jgi:uncharacterized protein (DUF2147 family)